MTNRVIKNPYLYRRQRLQQRNIGNLFPTIHNINIHSPMSPLLILIHSRNRRARTNAKHRCITSQQHIRQFEGPIRPLGDIPLHSQQATGLQHCWNR